MRVCAIGASGKLGMFMVGHALDRGHEVLPVCREQSVGKLDEFQGRIRVVPGTTNNRDVIRRAVAGCDPADLRQRMPLDGGARQRIRGRRE